MCAESTVAVETEYFNGCGQNSRAVVKSTFVESKTSASPGLSSPSQDRVQRGSSPSPSETVRRSKQKIIIYFKTTYLIIDNLCDTRDGISSILR